MKENRGKRCLIKDEDKKRENKRCRQNEKRNIQYEKERRKEKYKRTTIKQK